MIRTTRVRLCLAASAVAVLAGCSGTDLRRDRPYIERTTIESRPIAEPVRAITGFSDGLACMDSMLRAERVPTTLITSKQIPDPSSKASVAAKDMIFTALSEMSRTSNAFRIVDFEIDPLKQDTVQTLTSLMLPAGQLAIPKPAVYVSGAISYVDQNVLIRNGGIGASAKNWEIGYSNDVITTAVGLELHLGDFTTRTLFPGLDSANEIAAGNKGEGIDLGGRIKNAGTQLTIGGTISQGVGPAVRTLVELGMIEVIGKWARVPYWDCLALDQSHPEFQRQLREWYGDMSDEQRVRLFATALHALGYYDGSGDGRADSALRGALARYQADHQATVSGNFNFESYERLMTNYVATDGSDHFTRIGWGEGARAGTPRGGQDALDAEAARPIAVDITLDRKDPHFALGESLLLNVSVDHTAHLYCFYEDAKGTLTQVYPSTFQPAPLLQARRSLLIPDIANPRSYTLEMTQAGHEAATCLATADDRSTELQGVLGAAALEPIHAVAGTAALRQKLLELARGTHAGIGSVEWDVDAHASR